MAVKIPAIFWLWTATTGDGIVAALRFWLQCGNPRGLKTLLGDLVLYPQKLINVPVSRGFSWKDHPAIRLQP